MFAGVVQLAPAKAGVDDLAHGEILGIEAVVVVHGHQRTRLARRADHPARLRRAPGQRFLADDDLAGLEGDLPFGEDWNWEASVLYTSVDADLVTNSVWNVVRAERNDAHRIIEEFMIAANEAAFKASSTVSQFAAA